MPRKTKSSTKKTTTKKATKEKKVIEVSEPLNEVQETTPELPMFEGARVIEVLEENVNNIFHHCKMSDGTTKHVPIELFK